MALGPSEKGQHIVVDDVANARREARPGERELAALPKRVLHGSGQLADFIDLVPVDLVESDQYACAVLG